MKKRLLAMAAAACLLLALLPAPALAASAALDPGALGSYGSGKPWEQMTDEEKQRARLEQLLWYAWLSQRYAMFSFSDVPEDSWFYSGVWYVWQNSLMSGVSETSFAPNEPTNRAMAWTVLARMHKVNTKAAEGEAWYEPGVRWAVSQKLGDGTDPTGPITREYLAEMLWLCANGPIIAADLSGFSDRDQISPYAENAVRWAVANGLLQGDGERLSPQGSVTRAELAALVMRYQQLV